jgi:TfoX/Sxy family transcriptional regulator of competence genes
MSYDEAVAVRVRRVLARRRGVVEKRMVGGVSFLVRGALCCGVTGDRLMVRVGAAARGRMLAQPHTEPMKFAGRSLAGFICVKPAGYRSDRALKEWVQRGIDCVATLPSRRVTPRRGSA